jgi:hypothetical protein
MDSNFAKLVETLAPKLDELLTMKPLRHGSIPMTLPMKGVYLFSEGRKHLYNTSAVPTRYANGITDTSHIRAAPRSHSCWPARRRAGSATTRRAAAAHAPSS